MREYGPYFELSSRTLNCHSEHSEGVSKNPSLFRFRGERILRLRLRRAQDDMRKDGAWAERTVEDAGPYIPNFSFLIPLEIWDGKGPAHWPAPTGMKKCGSKMGRFGGSKLPPYIGDTKIEAVWREQAPALHCQFSSVGSKFTMMLLAVRKETRVTLVP